MNFEAAKQFIISELDYLSPSLTYHDKRHTLDVLSVAERLCVAENVAAEDVLIVRVAALLHDSGFLRHYRDHEQHSCQIAREMLPKFGFTEGAIARVCGIITATKIPQSPQTKLEKIVCDADLDYLGRADFWDIGQTLFQEMRTMRQLETEAEWNDLQVKFIENHQFFTKTSRTLRDATKAKHLAELRQQLGEKKM